MVIIRVVCIDIAGNKRSMTSIGYFIWWLSKTRKKKVKAFTNVSQFLIKSSEFSSKSAWSTHSKYKTKSSLKTANERSFYNNVKFLLSWCYCWSTRAFTLSIFKKDRKLFHYCYHHYLNEETFAKRTTLDVFMCADVYTKSHKCWWKR